MIEEGDYFIYLSNDVKLEIGKLQNIYIEFVDKFKINDMWEKAVSKFNVYLMSIIKDKLDEGNEIIKKYLHLQRRLELVEDILFSDDILKNELKIKKIKQKLEIGKKQVKKDILDDVEREINELMPPPPKKDKPKTRNDNPFKPGHYRFKPDWDSPAEH
jgi:hypothetical protein